MAPKRQAGSSTAASPAKKKAKNGGAQPSLASFFTSPKKTKDAAAQQEEKGQVESDEAMARRLQEEWGRMDQPQAIGNAADGKKKEMVAIDLTEDAEEASDAVAGPSKQLSSPSAAVAPLFRTPAKGKAKGEPEAVASTSKLTTFGASTSTSSKAGSSRIATSFDHAALARSIEALDLEADILLFDPHAHSTSTWPVTSEGVPSAPYALLAQACALLSATRSRIRISAICTNVLRLLIVHDPSSLAPAVCLLSNHIAPPYDAIELGLGGSLISSVIKAVTGASPKALKALWNKYGDPGDVAFEARKGTNPLVSPAPLTITKLFAALHGVARMSGQGSAASKRAACTRLLVAARGEETRYLIRTFDGNLRVRAVRTTLAVALARAFALDGPRPTGAAEPAVKSELAGPSVKKIKDEASIDTLCVVPSERKGILAHPEKAKDKTERWSHVMGKLTSAERIVREVRARHPDFESITNALLTGGIDQLSHLVPLKIGTPLAPMLGSITRSLPDMHARLGPRAFVSEFKYDGQRVQIHALHVPQDGSEEAKARKKELSGKGKARWVGEKGDVYVRLFSRHLEDITDKYPDICDLLPLLMGIDAESSSDAPSDAASTRNVTSLIVDAEIVALSSAGDLLPFQTLAGRSRKDVNIADVKVRVGIFAFDLMLLDGVPLLKRSFRSRREMLHTRLRALEPGNATIARFAHVKSCEATSPEEVERFFKEARDSKCEGIMVKSLDHHWELPPSTDKATSGSVKGEEDAQPVLRKLDDEVGEDIVQADLDHPDQEEGADSKASASDSKARTGKGVNGRGKALLSSYEPDKRCESWLKVKKDYVDGISDSLDLVPIGAWYGLGRKAGWWSPVLLAVYDSDTGQYVALCKCISGFTDAEYKSITFDRFKVDGKACYNARTEACRDEYDTGGLLPDVWFEPREVWEVRGADITISPNYTAALGLVSPERGLSLRFPRFIKRRDDKAPEDATKPAQIAALYFEQNAAPKAAAAAAEGKVEKDEEEEEDELPSEGEAQGGTRNSGFEDDEGEE